MEHGYLCSCQECNYERIVKLIREKYRMASNNQEKYEAHRRAYEGEDPFGRFKVNEPKDKQEPRYTTYYKHPDGNFYQNQPYNPGKYRRQHNKATNMIEFQYQPWPEAEWRTYFRVALETLVIKGADKQAVRNAAAALDLERFYKIERVDQTA